MPAAQKPAPSVTPPPAPARRPAAPPIAPLAKAGPNRRALLVGMLSTLALLNLAGLPYYLLSTGERVRHPWHRFLKPTGIIGQSAGVAALALFVFMWLYPLRKKFRALAFTGSIAKWLDVHVGAGLLIPVLAAMHAAWHFTGLIGVGYAAMMIVVLSGFVGRYLYSRIPRGREGLEMTREEIERERDVLLRYVASTSGLPVEEVARLLTPVPVERQGGGLVAATLRMMRDDLDRVLAARRLARGMRGPGKGAGRAVDPRVLRLVRRLARRHMALGQQVRLLDATQRVFRFWHVAHRPVAITALLAVMIHVGVAVAMGVTWFL